MSEDKTIRVTRRRRSGPSQSGDRERAATPRRGQREDSASPKRPSGAVTSGTGASGYGTTPSPTSQGYGQGFTGQTGGGTQLPLGGLLNLLGGRKLPPLLILGLIAGLGRVSRQPAGFSSVLCQIAGEVPPGIREQHLVDKIYRCGRAFNIQQNRTYWFNQLNHTAGMLAETAVGRYDTPKQSG